MVARVRSDGHGREPRRRVRIHHPDKEFEVHYPPEDSRYDNPRELHTLAMPVRGRLFDLDCHPFDLIWIREEWFPDPFQRQEHRGTADGVRASRRTRGRAGHNAQSPVAVDARRRMDHRFRSRAPTFALRDGWIDFARHRRRVPRSAPGWSMPWKGRRVLDYPPEKTYLETTWELQAVEVDPTFDKSDFEPPFGPDTLETAGPNRSPVVLPAESPPSAAPAGPEPRRAGWDPAATWGVIAAGVVALVCVVARTRKGNGGG